MDKFIKVNTSDLAEYLLRHPLDEVDLYDVEVIYQCLTTGEDKGMFPEYVSLPDYAKQHNVTRSQIYNLVREGRLKPKRLLNGYHIKKDTPYPEDRRAKAVGSYDDQNDSEYVTAAEYAKMWHVSRQEINELIQKGKLDSIKDGRNRLIRRDTMYPVRHRG